MYKMIYPVKFFFFGSGLSGLEEIKTICIAATKRNCGKAFLEKCELDSVDGYIKIYSLTLLNYL